MTDEPLPIPEDDKDDSVYSGLLEDHRVLADSSLLTR